MKNDVKYVTNQKRKRTVVQVPYEDWKHLTQENKKLKQLLKVRSNLQEAFQEIENYQSGKVQLKIMDQLLDEL